jgi:hypothetical protein
MMKRMTPSSRLVTALFVVSVIAACNRPHTPSTSGGHTNWLPCDSTAECRTHSDELRCSDGYCVDGQGDRVVVDGGKAGDGGREAEGAAGSDGDAGTGGGGGSAGCVPQGPPGYAGAISIPSIPPPENAACPEIGFRLCSPRTFTNDGPFLSECTEDGWKLIEDPSKCEAAANDPEAGCNLHTKGGDGICCTKARYCARYGFCDGTRWWGP